MTIKSTEPLHFFHAPVVTIFLGIFCLICILSIAKKSLTMDETVHLTAGASYWTFNDYRLHPENGNLPQRIAALPIFLSNECAPDSNNTDWQQSNVWNVSATYLFEELKNAEYIFFQGRILICLFTALGGIAIFLWSKQLWGLTGAYLSLTLFCLSPNFIANGRLMTSDALFASMFVICIAWLWKLLNGPNLKNIFIAGCILGATCVTKFSAVYILPIVFTLLVIIQFIPPLYQRNQEPGMSAVALAKEKKTSPKVKRHWHNLITRCAALFATALIAVFIIWGCYGFRYDGFAPEHPEGQYHSDWDTLLEGDEIIENTVSICRKLKLLPEAFLYGFSYVYKNSRERNAYFLGEHGTGGWPLFFPFTFISKTPLSTLVILILVLLGGGLKFIRAVKNNDVATLKLFYMLSPIVVAVMVVGAFSVTSSLNIGHRHILPIYPFIFILCGGLFHVLSAVAHRIKYPIIGLLVAYNIWATAAIFPDYIAYFNPLIGGPNNAPHYVLDSSLDWGQDLPRLKDWLEENNNDGLPYYLAYFGTDSPHFRGLSPRYLHSYIQPKNKIEMPPIEPGYYCISVSLLYGLYVPLDKPFNATHIKTWENSYHNMSLLWTQVHNPDAIDRVLNTREILQWRKDAALFQFLRFELLRNALLMREPVARIGYSIYVYHLNEQDINSIFGFRTKGFRWDYPYSKFFNQYLSPEETGIGYQVFYE